MQKIPLLFIVFIIISCSTKPSKTVEGEIIVLQNEYNLSLDGGFSDKSLPDSIPDKFLELKKQGKSLFNQRDYQKALEFYDKFIERVPECAEVYNDRGISRKNLGDLEGAIEDYTKAIELEPEFIQAYFNRAITKEIKEDYKSAIADYTKAIDINPRYAVAYNNRGILRKNLGDLRGAVEDYTKAIEIDEQDSQAYYNRANSKRSLRDNEGALLDYTKAIEIDPYYGNAYINRGVLKYEMGDYEGEIEDYRICLSMAKETNNVSLIEEVSNNLGRALYDLKRFEEAAEAYSEGILVAPDNGRLYYGRGLARNQSGDCVGACSDWRKSSMLGCFEANVLLPLCDECEVIK